MNEHNRNSETSGLAPTRPSREGDSQPRWFARILSVVASLLAMFRVIGAAAAEGRAQAPQSVHQPAEGDGHPASETFLHPSVRYERSDANLRWIIGLLIAALILAVVIHGAVWRFFIGYRDYQAQIKSSNYSLAPSTSDALPSEPRLEQINRLAGIEKSNVYVREESKEAILHGYGKTESDRYVHIPIDKAIDLLAQQKLGRKEQPTNEQAKRQNGLVADGEPNSGRRFRGKRP
jgi:hypothetical protein